MSRDMSRDMKRVVRAHDRLARVFADKRFASAAMGQEMRAWVVSWIWTVEVECPDDESERNRRAYDLAGFTDKSRRGWRRIVEADRPRFEPQDDGGKVGSYRECPAPMLRREGVCGQRTTSVPLRVTDPRTGQWKRVAYCRRHEGEGREVAAREHALRQSGTIPEPLPNTGGLLPCHVGLGNWPELYAWASWGEWKPPPLGICADDWPTLAKVATARPRLAAVEGDGERVAGDVPPPRLMVVRGGA